MMADPPVDTVNFRTMLTNTHTDHLGMCIMVPNRDAALVQLIRRQFCVNQERTVRGWLKNLPSHLCIICMRIEFYKCLCRI